MRPRSRLGLAMRNASQRDSGCEFPASRAAPSAMEPLT